MLDDRSSAARSPVGFTYEYTGHESARVSISDEANIHYMHPSYLFSDPLYDLVRAVVEVLRYGGSAGFGWYYEPGKDRWTLRREGDSLHITIRSGGDFSRLDWPDEGGELLFTTTSDLWKFAAKVRLAASRLTPTAEQDADPTWVQRTAEYRALCEFLETHKRTGHPPPSTKRR